MSDVRPAITPGDHVVDDEQLEQAFVGALETYPTGYVLLERWQDLVRDPETKGLEFVWRWHLQVIGRLDGYAPRELLLDLAVPLRPGTQDISDPDRLAARGKAALLLGIGQPAPQEEPETTPEEEDKVIDLPVQPPTPPPGPPSTALPHWDPNLFPG